MSAPPRDAFADVGAAIRHAQERAAAPDLTKNGLKLLLAVGALVSSWSRLTDHITAQLPWEIDEQHAEPNRGRLPRIEGERPPDGTGFEDRPLVAAPGAASSRRRPHHEREGHSMTAEEQVAVLKEQVATVQREVENLRAGVEWLRIDPIDRLAELLDGLTADVAWMLSDPVLQGVER